ncbi:MAG: metallophosphoesterase family protein [Oligoflexia bacterium]|nr:metallophosphoesterase family protein [Oligoflexia bacterium]
MKKKYLIIFLSNLLNLCLSIFLVSNAFANKVGILGDIHGDLYAFKEALKNMKSKGVTEIILTGDYGDIGEVDLGLALKALGIFARKEKVFITLGDEEQYPKFLKNNYQNVVRYYKKFGVIINPDGGIESGIIVIDGKKILVSHFPQHKIPIYAGPILEDISTRKTPKQAMIIDTMAFDDYPATTIDLEIFAHTHKMVSYVYEDSKGDRLRVINPGAINGRKIGANEFIAWSKMIPTFAIFDTSSREVNFYNASTGTGIHLEDSRDSAEKIFKPSRGDLHWVSVLEKSGERPWEMLQEIHKANKNKDKDNLNQSKDAIAAPVVCPIPLDG